MTPPRLSDSQIDRPSTAAGLVPSTPVEELGEAIAELAARLHAATYELLVMLREFDAHAGWNNGFLSCAHWLHWRTGIDLAPRARKCGRPRRWRNLPRLSGAMQRGEISYAKVRALTRIATPDNEPQLLDLAYNATAAQVERVARAWRRCDRLEDARDTDRRHLARSVTTWVDDDGMVVVRARLTPELGAVVQRALEAASDQLYQESRQAAPPDSIVEEVSSAQRRADALALLAERALENGLDGGSAADRYQVVLHFEQDTPGDCSSRRCSNSLTAASTFLRKRRGACRATRRSSRCEREPMGPRSMSAAKREPFRPQFAERSPRVTSAAVSRDALPAVATRITSPIGPTAA